MVNRRRREREERLRQQQAEKEQTKDQQKDPQSAQPSAPRSQPIRINLYCPFCSYPIAEYQLPLPPGTVCTYCKAAVTTQDISPHFGMFDPKAYLVTGKGRDGQDVTVRVTAVSESAASWQAEKAGVTSPTQVQLEPSPQLPAPSWRERFKLKDHLIFAALAVVPGIGWVMSAWQWTGSALGGAAAIVLNYLVLRLAFALSVEVARRHHGPERLAELARARLPERTLPIGEATAVEVLGNLGCGFLTLGAIISFGPLMGSFVGIVIMWPLAVFSRDERVQGTHVFACFALYFLAGVFLASQLD